MKKKVIGGQAVMEGVMMRSPTKMAMAVRQENGKIVMSHHPVTPKTGWNKAPFIRGVVSFVVMLQMGFETLAESVRMLGLEEEEPGKFEKWLSKKTGKSSEDIALVVGGALAVVLCLALFIFLPNLVASGLTKLTHNPFLVNLLEGCVRLLLFIGYLAAISLMPDIRRFFAYHGAEHKVVNCYEAGLTLNVENAQKQTTLNPRCGTSFMLIVVLISVLVFSLTGWSGAWWARILIRIALLPIVTSISYEVLMLLAKNNGWFVCALRWPGMQLQRMTTREPDDSMVEVSLAAFIAVLEDEERQECAPQDYRLPDEPVPESPIEVPCPDVTLEGAE
jgi:uncharacterized protein YqhQ